MLLDSSCDSWEDQALFVKIGDRVLDLMFDTFSGISGPNLVSRPQTQSSRDFLRFHDFIGYCIYFMILEKMRPCLWKLELGFWTYGLTRLLGPSSPIVVSMPQTPKSINILRFNDFIGFILWFFKKWGPASENLSQVSRLRARYAFWGQVTQI